ncbi:MAG: hypothetical protein A07HN63_02427 [uncultured archaeon A07HN63]|nr:MAG: hypothetical protein A07HN63_02427 [uncultured archaeon A07HN63]
MSRRRLFGSLCGLVFFLNLARIIFAPLLDVFIAEFPIGEATAGLIVTIAWVGSASLRLPAGWLLTKVPRHYLVIVAGTILTLFGGGHRCGDYRSTAHDRRVLHGHRLGCLLRRGEPAVE